MEISLNLDNLGFKIGTYFLRSKKHGSYEYLVVFNLFLNI